MEATQRGSLSAGRSRQRNGNNNEQRATSANGVKLAAGPSVTCNNDRDTTTTTTTKRAHGFCSKIFRQYLPSSFNLNQTLAKGGNACGSRQSMAEQSQRKKRLQQKLDDYNYDYSDYDDDDDDDEKVNFAKKGKNNADEGSDCRLRQQQARAELRGEDAGGELTQGDHHHHNQRRRHEHRASGETPLLGRREPGLWTGGRDLAPLDSGNNSRPDAANKEQKQGEQQGRKVFESQMRDNNQRRKIESSSSTTTTTRAATAASSSFNNGLKSIANAFTNKLARATTPSASGRGTGDSLKLFSSSSSSALPANNDPSHRHHRKDYSRRGKNSSDSVVVNQKYLAKETDKTGGGSSSSGGQKYDCATTTKEELHRQRELELVLERRRNELREQLSKYKEQVRADSKLGGNGGANIKRKGFLHLKRNGAATFALNANHALIRLKNSKTNRQDTLLESTSALIGESTEQQNYDHELIVENASLAQQQQQKGSESELKLGRDQNNNNNNDEENTRQLLIDLSLSHQEQEQRQQTTSNNDSGIMPESSRQAWSSSSTIRQRPMAKSSSSGGRKQLGPLLEGSNTARPRPTAASKPVPLLVLMLTLVILCLVAFASIGPHQFALAQHQPPPFTRSQPMMLQATGHQHSPQAPPRSGLSPAQLPSQQQQHQQQQQHLPPPPPTQSLQQQQQQPQSQQQPQQQPSPLPATGSLVANINCNKIRGHVTLTPNLQGGTTVTTQITAGPPGEVYQWSIHQFPIKPGAAMCSCSALILGSKLVDLSEMHGNLPSDQEFSVQSSLPLFGFDSPVGHSLLLRGLKTGMVACGTFLPTSRKSNYRAKFHTPFSGSITVFQTAFGTSFLSHLMYSNGTRRHSMHRFDILRSEDDPPLAPNSLLLGGQQASATGSNLPPSSNFNQIEQREHENELQACRRFPSGEALFKNLTYQLSVSTENFGMRGRTALVLPQIPFETFSSVYVVVYSEHDPMEPIACAPLRFVKPKTAAAKFQTVSVQGQIVFSQDSPYDVTVARVNLNFPNSDGHSYGIDELPMIIRRKSDTRVCPNIREIIYNPHHIEPSSVPPEGEATSDQYAVGDLSGKYGSLTGKQSEKITVNDHNLPLFGPVSIIGRALTIYSADGVAIACSNVELTSPMTTAFATFDFGIQGQFIFRQQMNDCNGDTYVYIEVSKPTVGSGGGQQQSAVASLAGHHSQDHNQMRSLDHNWHIHEGPVDSGLEHLSTTECAAAGGHFNPYNTSTSSIYSRDCTPFNVLRCELGDLSSKMFTIEIPPYKVKSGGQEPDIGKFFGTDIDLPLCGPVSIVNRSVVVHVADFGSQRLACSTVIEFKPRT